MFLKGVVSDKDQIILSLHKELQNKNISIKTLNEEIIQLKTEKQEQEDSFQNIIKDFQFLSEFNSNNVNSQSYNFDSLNKNVNFIKICIQK
jgi:hypothetical protein